MKTHRITRRQAIKTAALTTAAVAVAGRFSGADTLQPAPVAASKPGDAPSGPFKLPPLGYAFDALEPHIDAQTMRIHHDKHHAAYVQNLNKAVAGHPDLGKKSVDDLIRDLNSIPEAIRTAVRNQGGGHANHSLFWQTLKKGGEEQPQGELAGAMDKKFKSFSMFQESFTKAALGVFGSGWTWLSLNPKKELLIESTPNQDSPLSVGNIPLFGIDVWEHAYYLKYQNKRADYVAAFYKVINWEFVAERYQKLAS